MPTAVVESFLGTAMAPLPTLQQYHADPPGSQGFSSNDPGLAKEKGRYARLLPAGPAEADLPDVEELWQVV